MSGKRQKRQVEEEVFQSMESEEIDSLMAKEQDDSVTVEELKLQLWKQAQSFGFGMPCFNCVYRENYETGLQERFNFRDEKVLRFETKRRSPSGSWGWVTECEAEYSAITVNEDGGMVFPSVN